MFTRILTSVIAFPILGVIIYLGGLPLKILMAAITITGMLELYRAINGKISILNLVSCFFIAVYYYFVDIMNADIEYIIISAYILSNMVYLVANHTKITPVECAVNVFGFFYVGVLLSAISLTRFHAYGRFLVWLIFISAWGCDSFAYFTGISFGKHKLTPVLSPKKTVEGAVGGVLGAMLVGFIYAFALSRFTNINNEINLIFLFVMVSGFGAAFSIIGDLTASAIKRYTGIKDYGKIIPGHGGILDRFDSIIFTAPAVYVIIRLMIIYK